MEKIAAIVVTYNPDEGLNKSTKSLIKQVDSIIMVDNGSNDEGKEIINKIKKPRPSNKGRSYSLTNINTLRIMHY